MNTQGIRAGGKPQTLEQWKEVLNEFQFEELKRIAENPVLIETIEKVLCYEIVAEGRFDKDKPFDSGRNYFLNFLNGAASMGDDKRLGEITRGLIWGMLWLQDGIGNIRRLKVSEEKVVGEKTNDAV